MAQPNPYIKQYLMTVGPTPLPPEVQLAGGQTLLYHRSPEFVELLERVLTRLPPLFGTSNDVLLFASSGSGAMESAVSNLVSPGDKVLACAAGKFGERWIELGEAYGAEVVRYEPGWGERLDANEIDQLLRDNDGVEVAYATLSETSTGIVHDIAAIAEVCGRHDVMLAVDAISAVGALECRQDEWGVDVVVCGSQKALMCPPGLGFASVSQRALDRAAQRGGRRYYFDWTATAKAQRKSPPDTAFTSPVTLIAQLDVALGLIEREGLENVLARHELLGRAARAGAQAMGLELFGDPDERANVVTAVELPESIDGKQVPKLLRDRYGITANGGQGQLAGRILRIGHVGYFGPFDIVVHLAALELVLRELGADVEQGAGVAAAQQVFLDAGVETPAPSA